MIADDVDNNIVYDFPCRRWLATDEDDGMTSRDLIVNVGAMNIAPGNYLLVTTLLNNCVCLSVHTLSLVGRIVVLKSDIIKLCTLTD